MNWTDERIEMLTKLWADGLSASQIATQLGGVSRNAVIGKVHRLKLRSRDRTSANVSSKRKAPHKPATAKAAATTSVARSELIKTTTTSSENSWYSPQKQDLSPIEDVVVPISRGLKLVELNESVCKWPNGDPISEEFCFCGNETGESGPYCNYHSRLAYQPASKRRRYR